MVVSTVTGREGIENPAHGPRISTPKGRGRCSALARVDPMPTTTTPTPSQTNRCRHRRHTARTARLASHSTWIAVPVVSTAAASATQVSVGERSRLIDVSTEASATSTNMAVPVAMTTSQVTPTAQLSASHHLPDALRCRGSGGGSPEGRRRRPT
jgi:hypothetical protein